MSAEDDGTEIAAAEYRGRTERVVAWKIREVRGFEVLNEDPCRYILEVIRSTGSGSMGSLHAVTEADLKALGALLQHCPHDTPLEG